MGTAMIIPGVDFSAKCIRTVTRKPTSISISGDEIVYNNGTYTIVFEPTIATGNIAWSITSGSEYATIDQSGNVTAISTGSVKIKATLVTDTSIYAEKTITVKNVSDIIYTSSDNNIIVPGVTTGFGANIVSNVYSSDKGTITFDGNITSIPDSAFSSLSKLVSITIPNTVTTIGSSAFQGCSGLTSITIPSSVTTINDHAFNGCSGLTSITIPSTVTTLGNNVFYNCTSLTSATIQANITSIDNNAFYGCTKLSSVNLSSTIKTIGSSSFLGCTSLTTVTIPSDVTTINSEAFSGCTGLTSITIPSKVTTIGSSVFYNCSSLNSITCEPTTAPTIANDTFYGVATSGTLTVPGNSDYSGWMSTENYYLGSYSWTLNQPYTETASITISLVDGDFTMHDLDNNVTFEPTTCVYNSTGSDGTKFISDNNSGIIYQNSSIQDLSIIGMAIDFRIDSSGRTGGGAGTWGSYVTFGQNGSSSVSSTDDWLLCATHYPTNYSSNNHGIRWCSAGPYNTGKNLGSDTSGIKADTWHRLLMYTDRQFVAGDTPNYYLSCYLDGSAVINRFYCDGGDSIGTDMSQVYLALANSFRIMRGSLIGQSTTNPFQGKLRNLKMWRTGKTFDPVEESTYKE